MRDRDPQFFTLSNHLHIDRVYSRKKFLPSSSQVAPRTTRNVSRSFAIHSFRKRSQSTCVTREGKYKIDREMRGNSICGRILELANSSSVSRELSNHPPSIRQRFSENEPRSHCHFVNVAEHKNVRAFITHGGLMGTQEAIVYAVPLIGIPLFGDQRLNVNNYVDKKIAISLNSIAEVTEEKLTSALNNILNDPSYR